MLAVSVSLTAAQLGPGFICLVGNTDCETCIKQVSERLDSTMLTKRKRSSHSIYLRLTACPLVLGVSGATIPHQIQLLVNWSNALPLTASIQSTAPTSTSTLQHAQVRVGTVNLCKLSSSLFLSLSLSSFYVGWCNHWCSWRFPGFSMLLSYLCMLHFPVCQVSYPKPI